MLCQPLFFCSSGLQVSCPAGLQFYRSAVLPGWQMELPPQFSQPQEQPPFPLRRFFTSRTTMAAKIRKTISPTIKVERFMVVSFPANDDARPCGTSCRTLHLRHLCYLAASTARMEVKVLSAVPFRNRSQSMTPTVTAAATVPRPKLPPFSREPNW